MVGLIAGIGIFIVLNCGIILGARTASKKYSDLFIRQGELINYIVTNLNDDGGIIDEVAFNAEVLTKMNAIDEYRKSIPVWFKTKKKGD